MYVRRTALSASLTSAAAKNKHVTHFYPDGT